MSTRANVILKDGDEKLFFYRHSDGYPEGTMPTLKKFVDLMKDDKIRNNLGQASGWLIIIGAIEYKSITSKAFQISKENRKEMSKYMTSDYEVNNLRPNDWKAGAYEPTTGIHGDIEYLYTIDLKKLTIETKSIY